MLRPARALALAVLVACGSGAPPPPAAAPPVVAPQASFDLVITHGRVIDGTGSAARAADVGIRDGHVAALGDLAASPRARTIDAAGMVVAPGFIDMLGQSETTLLVDPRAPSKIYQGVTTEITGEGTSVAPQTDALVKTDHEGWEYMKLTCDWRTFRQYFARLEKQGIGINLASYVGEAQVRRVVLGDDDVQPTPAQLEQMKALVRDAMHDGAVGLSTSLLYPPAPYATTEELIALATEAGKLGGIYATHMRDEADKEMAALDEALRIGREAHIPVEIWHIKAAGMRNWGKMKDVIAKIEDARKQGLDVSANTYAYPAWGNGLSALLPPGAQAGGTQKLLARLADPKERARIKQEIVTPTSGWSDEWRMVPTPESWLVTSVGTEALRPLQGKNLAQIAAEWHEDGLDAALDLVAKDRGMTSVAVFGMSDEDIAYALRRRARGPARKGAQPPTWLRRVPAHPPEVRPRGALAHARGGHPKVHLASRRAHAPGGPWRARTGPVGRRRRVRPADRTRRGDLRRSEPVRPGDALRPCQRGSRHRRRKDDGGKARASHPRAGLRRELASRISRGRDGLCASPSRFVPRPLTHRTM
jgi:dihydroorotase/N-acyl-D-amino-acid deacylase